MGMKVADFKVLSQKERDKMPTSDYAQPPDGYPISDENHYHQALRMLGHISDPKERERVRRRANAIARRKGYKVSEDSGNDDDSEHSWWRPEPADLLDTALFDDNPPPGYVRREGIIFRIGDYPEKQFSLSVEEADRAVANFTPVPGDLEHVPTVLNGNLGIMRRIRREGQDILGQADVPEWLDGILKQSASSVSCAWDRATKLMKGWGWVIQPHIEGAALMSAYADFKARDDALVNSMIAQQNAYVPYDTPLTKEQAKRRYFMPLIDKLPEAYKKRLALFNASMGNPGTSDTGVSVPSQVPTQPAQPTQTPAQPSAPTTYPPAPTQPAAPPTPTSPGAPGTPTTPVEPSTAPGVGVGAPPGPATLSASFRAPGLPPAEVMDEETATFRADQIVNNATDIADRLIKAGVLYSSGRPAAIAAFTNAGFDNEVSGPSLATFTKLEGNAQVVMNDRVRILQELFKHVAKHSLFSAELPVGVMNATPGASDRKTAEQQGKEQADAWNAQVTPKTPSTNGAH